MGVTRTVHVRSPQHQGNSSEEMDVSAPQLRKSASTPSIAMRSVHQSQLRQGRGLSCVYINVSVTTAMVL